MQEMIVSPFVKWAGGKRQLIEQLTPLFPKKFNRYFEPFVGGGAVAFHIIQNYSPEEVFLSDINSELINAYNTIKKNTNELIELLKIHQSNHNKKYYYNFRDSDTSELSNIELTARFIYLNRTCFNGLYRVNSKGQFNVPMGKYANPEIVQEEKLLAMSKLLKSVQIKQMSFEKITKLAKAKDFVYFDPPYYPLENKTSFTTYTKDNFSEEDQIKLANVFQELSKKDTLCVESNSDTKFIKSLYSKFNIDIVKASRRINSIAKERGEINEVVIRNY